MGCPKPNDRGLLRPRSSQHTCRRMPLGYSLTPAPVIMAVRMAALCSASMVGFVSVLSLRLHADVMK